ncbi:hypothetical protein GALMADRAFT_240161 [Galerina marginata CBS 339.88]|uniref:Single hybrid motif-containing protein n=1 Tax=Galerina marginata (strain CBS 339.88) TaxID=685588 RepID=A0A067TFG3_GALM3|nr:hypothetical protein GALMADRAFT_240161 [Galerina marginata CBS 339.88]
MASITAVSRACRSTQLASQSKRLLHGSAARRAITHFQMPAMSPTMTEGGIASWKKKDGDSFAQGDVLLEIETDKATIDVEAADDGIMGKILAPDGTKAIPVGKVIALLAEEGDDISNLEAPKDEPTPPPKQAEAPPPPPSTSPPPPPSQQSSSQSSEAHSNTPPEHARPLFPSVHRLLLEHNVTSTNEIKGTGVRGMLTKGDVLTFLGKASSPLGTFKPGPSPIEEANKSRGTTTAQAAAPPPLDGPSIRRLIVSSMLTASIKARNPVPASIKETDFDSVIADYLPPSPKASQQTPVVIPSSSPQKSADYLDDLY